MCAYVKASRRIDTVIDTAQDLKTYKKKIKEALTDPFLRDVLQRFNHSYRDNRTRIYRENEFEDLRRTVSEIKSRSIPLLKELFEQFEAQAEAAGAKVYFAEDAAAANRLIGDIARENNVRSIIKSKSMTAEEIFLNGYLEALDMEVTETDLGEWIIQLRKEGPSHMVMPAIHLSRFQVADLFSKVTRTDQDGENIDRLVKVARSTLRRKFLKADMGITGANFALADSGAIGLVTNEGNGRLVTTLPPIHVALIGMEKLVPDLKSAIDILRVLPRNATGQQLTSYITWIKGANEQHIAGRPRKQVHLIFLDNGRLALAGDPAFRETLKCIRCGACANVCPIYSNIGGHKYGHVYIGAIGLILTFFFHGSKNDRAIVQNCINCQACKAVCPAGIDLPYLIKKTLGRVRQTEGKRPVKNHVLTRVMKDRRLFHALLRNARRVQKPFSKSGPVIRHLPHVFTNTHGFNNLPDLAPAAFRDQWKRVRKDIRNPDCIVALFAGCAIDFIYPRQAMAFYRMMLRLNIQVDFPDQQTCCGLPLLMAAEEAVARDVALQNIAAFSGRPYDYIVTLCASCASHLIHHYEKLLAGRSGYESVKSRFMDRVMDFSSFMIHVLKVSPDRFKASEQHVAYHAPCHLCRGLNVVSEPRELLKIAGYTYQSTPDEDVCCGFGGSYSVDFPEISSRILQQKLDTLSSSGVRNVATDCPGCVLQIQGGFDRINSPVQVRHTAEWVAENLKG